MIPADAERVAAGVHEGEAGPHRGYFLRHRHHGGEEPRALFFY